MNETATAKRIQDSLRIDLRRMRAASLAAQAIQAIDPFVDRQVDTARSDAYYALLELFTTQGVEVLTDADREAAGLSPRGEDGWTPEEMAALDNARLEMLLKPLAFATHFPTQQQEKE